MYCGMSYAEDQNIFSLRLLSPSLAEATTLSPKNEAHHLDHTGVHARTSASTYRAACHGARLQATTSVAGLKKKGGFPTGNGTVLTIVPRTAGWT